MNTKASKYFLAQYKETGILFIDDAKSSATFKGQLVLTQCRAGDLLRADSQTLGHAASSVVGIPLLDHAIDTDI